MVRSRLNSLKEKRDLQQAFGWLVLASVLLVGFLFWGLPALARFVGNTLIKSDDTAPATMTLKPRPPILSDIPVATNSADLVVNGFAQPGMSVELYNNAESVGELIVDDSGTFIFPSVKLSEGENRLYAFAKLDSAQSESEQSKEYLVVVDTTKPEVVIESPAGDSVFHSERERVVKISGKVNEAVKSLLIGDNLAIVSPELVFSVDYQLAEGDQELVISAVDLAGNVSEQSLKLRYER